MQLRTLSEVYTSVAENYAKNIFKNNLL